MTLKVYEKRRKRAIRYMMRISKTYTTMPANEQEQKNILNFIQVLIFHLFPPEHKRIISNSNSWVFKCEINDFAKKLMEYRKAMDENDIIIESKYYCLFVNQNNRSIEIG